MARIVLESLGPFYRPGDLADGPTGVDTLGAYQLDLMPVGFTALYRGLELPPLRIHYKEYAGTPDLVGIAMWELDRPTEHAGEKHSRQVAGEDFFGLLSRDLPA